MTSPSATHTAALEYAARGWRVFPLPPGTKTPRLKAWQDKATTDRAQIDTWWTAKPDSGVAIATGPETGIWVLDVDVADGKTGDETFADLEATHGQLPPTMTSITGSGGLHYLWAWPDGADIRNNAGTILGPGLDVRGDGGFIVAPPSTHPNGTHYEWDLGEPDQPVEAPAWLLELVDHKDEPKSATIDADSSEHVNTGTTRDDRPGDMWAQATDWADILQPDGWTLAHTDRHTGERHWTRPGKDQRDGTSATTGYTDNDTLKIFTSSMTHVGLDPEGVYTKLGYLAAVHHQGDHAEAAKALADAGWAPPQPQLADVIDLATFTAVEHDADGDLEHEEGYNPLAKWLVNWDEFWTIDHSATDWICEPIFAAGRAHALYAGAKTGKSWITLAACAAIASGQEFLLQPPGDPVDVLYVDYEMTPDDLHDRLTQFGYGPEHDLTHLHYALLPSLPPLDTPEGGIALTIAAEAVDAQFVVIDTTGRAVKGEENDAHTYQDFYRCTGLLLKQRGIGWARLDHAGKDNTLGQRGSSAKNDDVDIVVKLTRNETGVTLDATHRRIGWYPEQTLITITEDDYGNVTIRPSADSRSYVEGAFDLARTLDDHEIPIDWGRRKIRDHLKREGVKAGNRELSDAIRWRRDQAITNVGRLVDNSLKSGPRNPRTRPDDEWSKKTRTAHEKPLDNRRGPLADHRGPPPPPKRGPVSVSIYGHVSAGPPETDPDDDIEDYF